MNQLATPDLPTPSPKSLQGKVALITGASSGIGAHVAQVLASRGAHVVCAARRLDRLETLVETIQEQGGSAHAIVMDVADEASVIAGISKAEEIFSVPTIVIANAGLNAPGMATEVTMQDYDDMMAVNQRGVFLTAREGARRLLAVDPEVTRTGRIVLIASMAGLRPLPGLAAYSVSKAGVIMMARALAREWARAGINVNAICPGYIETEINADWLDQPAGQKMLAGFPRKRVMDIDALDEALLYLVSDAARYITGAVIQVDDGQGL
jgi:NAD(P)-dependent dehydrogenase (short-subunit alcohol dehydrogenase family)